MFNIASTITVISLSILLLARKQKRKKAHGQASETNGYSIIDHYQPNNPKWMIDVKGDTFWVDRGLKETKVSNHQPSLPRDRFALDSSFAYLNHGSYGATFKACLRLQSWWRDRMEEHPVRFMEKIALPSLLSSLAQLSALMSSHDKGRPRGGTLLPVVNSTQAANAVISSALCHLSTNQQHGSEGSKGMGIKFKAIGGPKARLRPIVIFTSLTYPAVKSTIIREAERTGAIPLMMHIKPSELIEGDVEGLLSSLLSIFNDYPGHPTLAVFDHVVSFPPVILPVKRMVDICKERGALVLVDGAHAIGSIAGLDVASIGANFYCGNLHKWLCAPKGAAFLWVSDASSKILKPLAVSHGYSLGIVEEFIWAGTQDLSAWLSLPAALKELEELGGIDKVAKLNDSEVKRMGRMLVDRWAKLRLLLDPEGSTDLRILGGEISGFRDSEEKQGCCSGITCPMLAVELPRGLGLQLEGAGRGVLGGHEGDCSVDQAAALNLLLRERFKIEVPVACWAGSLWVRISHHVGYNSVGDYIRLAEAIEELFGEIL